MGIVEFINNLNNLFQKDSYAIVLSFAGASMGFGVLTYLLTQKNKIKTIKGVILDLEVKVAKMRVESLDLPEDERLELQDKLEKLDIIIQDFYQNASRDNTQEKSKNKQSGFISQDFMLYAIPAIIALTFTFALVYLLIANQTIPNYQTPEILKTGITTIIGYYFGVAVKDKPVVNTKSTNIEDLQKQVAELIASTK